MDMKHKNIGATVSLLSRITDMLGEEGAGDLPQELSNLFDAESSNCDHKQKGCCFIEVDPEEVISPPLCCIQECPLGEMLDEEINSGKVDLDSSPFIGPCAGCAGPVTFENVGHFDDHHQVCKSCFEQKDKH
jgi:hypothetical protein